MIRPFVHALPPERAHEAGLWALRRGLVPPQRISVDPILASNLWGLSFKHPLGLAAGFDKNAEAVGALFEQGFAFVEAGTVTPRPQAGNPQPRIFRLKEDGAVINRLGFNNGGLSAYAESLVQQTCGGVVGANIGKNKDSEDAVGDYLAGLEKLYPLADYITINISSPNTVGLRALQKREALSELLTALMDCRETLQAQHQHRLPLLLKIAPDLDEEDLAAVCETALKLSVDGMIVSNTTIKRPRSLKSPVHGEQGGLSGAPLFALSTEILAQVYRLTEGNIPLVGVGGVSSAQDAYKKIRAGASLVQLYTALVYQGFGVVKHIVEGLPPLLKKDGFRQLSDAVGVDAIRR